MAGGDLESQREREARIWGADGPRWFGPDDPIWWVHSDPSVFVGGIAALLVQALHPLAMAGVMGHSTFRDDPWHRLNITADHVAVTTYAPIPQAQRQIRTVNAVHTRVSGVAPDGRAYAAFDPHLLAWVHAGQTWAFHAAYQAYGPRPLTAAQSDDYVAAMAQVAIQLGVLDPPRTLAGLEGELTAYRSELAAGPQARETVAFLLDQPPLTGVERLTYGRLCAAALTVVPDWTRTMLGRELGPRQRAVSSWWGGRTVAALRWALDHPAHEPAAQARFRTSAMMRT